MHPILKSQMNAFASEHDLAGSDSEKFEVYSVYSVLNGKYGNNVGPEVGHLKGTEFGIDGIGIFVNGEIVESPTAFETISKIYSAEIHFIQCKTSSSFDYGEFAKFVDGVVNFLDGKNRGLSEDLTLWGHIFDALYASSSKWSTNPQLRLSFVFSGSANLDGHSTSKIDSFVRNAKEKSLFSEISVDVFGAQEMQNYYRRATESATATFEFKNQITMPDNDRVTESYIGYLPVSELVKIVTVGSQSEPPFEINRKIFFDNVREYDPDSSINESISRELPLTPESFVFRNNGVTIVARKSSRTGDRFKIEALQVVNGCQTCNIIMSNIDKGIDKLTVPLRLIVSQDEEFINSIIIGTNKQNPVREEQFWALKPLLKQFEEFARAQSPGRALYFERRENQYRFENVPEKTRIIEPSALMKSVVSMYLNLPHRAGRDYREVKKEFSDQLFLDDHDVQLYYAAALSYYRIEFCYRTGRIATENKKYRMYYIWAIGRLCGVGGNILSLKGKKAHDLSAKICEFCEKDDELVKFISEITKVIDDCLKKNSISVEQLRNESASEVIRTAVSDHIVKIDSAFV